MEEKDKKLGQKVDNQKGESEKDFDNKDENESDEPKKKLIRGV